MMKKKIASGMVAIDSIKPYKNNARVHGDQQIARLVASLQEFGWVRPIITDETGMILAGHGMYEAAKTSGESEVPILVKSGLTTKQKKAYILADNALASLSKWDEDLLRIELTSLDIDLAELTGFKEFELAKFTRPGEVDAALDEPIAEPATTTVKAGDVYILGNHRLMCGNSCSQDDVTKLMGGGMPHLLVSDPPYGVDYKPEWRDGHDLNIGKGFDGKQGRSIGKTLNDDRADWHEAWLLFPGTTAYIWHAGVYASIVSDSLERAGFKIRAQIIWNKQHFVFGRGDYHWKHEPCWYAVKGKSHWNGGRQQTTVWEINNNNPFGNGAKTEEKVGHSAQKPIECMRRPILNNSKKGDAVYDPFVGSGTTLIACELEGRHCLAMEINPIYVQMTIDRWEKHVGQKAIKA